MCFLHTKEPKYVQECYGLMDSRRQIDKLFVVDNCAGQGYLEVNHQRHWNGNKTK